MDTNKQKKNKQKSKPWPLQPGQQGQYQRQGARYKTQEGPQGQSYANNAKPTPLVASDNNVFTLQSPSLPAIRPHCAPYPQIRSSSAYRTNKGPAKESERAGRYLLFDVFLVVRILLKFFFCLFFYSVV